jgi:streptomycin 6-kinase
MMGAMPLVMPRNLTVAAEQQGRQAWLASLPTTIAALQERWELIEVGDPFQPGGQTAWVATARSATKGDVALKVAWRHTESAHEAEGLRAWNGHGAVRLHEVHETDDTVALLIEMCVPGSTLATRPEPEQDTVIAGLLHQLWHAPSGQPFRPLQTMCDAWADGFEQKVASGASTLDSGLAREGIRLFRALPATADRTVLLCTDLHAGNVLAAEREPWLVIDPKPYAGDPTYDALQHMLNCDRRLHAGPRDLVSRMADLLDLDSDRLLLWLFARCVQESPDWPGLAEVARRIAPG